MKVEEITIPVMADLHARGEQPEFLYWVGCAGAFDDRYKKVVRAFTKLLVHLRVSFAVLGKEESCSGDPARRAGNEMLYQMQALQNIEVFNRYGVKKILTTCPHCYNIFKNEYPDLGSTFEVVHYIHLLLEKLAGKDIPLENLRITYHDPCYLGRANGIYEEPRALIRMTSNDLRELRRNRSFALCCGAGGAQMFKEAEKGSKEIFIERIEEVLAAEPDVVATACPFCMTMITDGLKYKNKETGTKNLDIAELLVQALNL